jgi:hypothetical protein
MYWRFQSVIYRNNKCAPPDIVGIYVTKYVCLCRVSSALIDPCVYWAPALGGVGSVVLCKTCSVLLYVLEQPRVDNSSAWPLKHGSQLGAIGLIEKAGICISYNHLTKIIYLLHIFLLHFCLYLDWGHVTLHIFNRDQSVMNLLS